MTLGTMLILSALAGFMLGCGLTATVTWLKIRRSLRQLQEVTELWKMTKAKL